MLRALALLVIAGCAFEGRGSSLDAAPIEPDTATSCDDATMNGSETDVDCGGSCTPCAVGLHCLSNADCDASVCDDGRCRLATQCNELHLAHPSLGDASYPIDPDRAGVGVPFATYCDMTVDGGGWTLIGKADGEHAMAAEWLVSDVDVAALASPKIKTASYACIDAVALAVDHSTELRITNSIRTAWVKWPLPEGREPTTWWRHSVGWATVNAAPALAVNVTTSTGTTTSCFQNVFGIMPHSGHGGSYPFTSYNEAGNTIPNDACMAVGTTLFQSVVDGFNQNGNGFDSPADETTWPNPAYHIPSHVAVWLR